MLMLFFCVFREGVPYQAFLDKLNDLHPNLKFTYELGPKMLHFLDTCISLPTSSTDSFTSKIFRKSSYTSLILNFFSNVSTKMEIWFNSMFIA